MSITDLIASLRYKCLLKLFKWQFKRLDFDTGKIDNRIAKLAEFIYRRYTSRFGALQADNRPLVAYIATELYSVGGHTPCVVNLAESMTSQEGGQVLYLSRLKKTEASVPAIIQRIRSAAGRVEGVDDSVRNVVNNTIELYNRIVSFSPRNLVIFIHQNDILSAMVLYLLKQHTDIKLVFWNHASHYPNVAMHYAHCILEGTPTTLRVTEERRFLHNGVIFGLQSKPVEQVVYYSTEAKAAKRAELGIEDGELLTVSGGHPRKFFTPDDESEYFGMVLNLLKTMPHLKHVVMSSMGQRELKVIENIFAGYEGERSRLLLLQPSREYELVFQCSDLYIDSLPIGSAMTQIDCMYNKVPTVVYVNTGSLEHTFHEYMPPDYPYMYENVQLMEQGIRFLLANPKARQDAVELNYNYWLNNYESRTVAKKYLNIFDALRNEN